MMSVPADLRGAARSAVMVKAALLVLALLAGAGSSRAQEIEPRAYSNIPVGVNFLVAGYAHASGGLISDPTLPLENADMRTEALAVAYARGIDVGGMSGKIDAMVPFGSVSGTAEYAGLPQRRSISGLGDARLRFSLNLLGAPALTVKDLASFQQDTIVGFSVQVSAPVGQYDGSRLINIGTNRWAVKSELGVSKAIGRWTLELMPAVTFFDDNDDFLGGRTREQDPVYSIQGGLVYGFASGIWAALSGTYYTGGRTTVDGDDGNDLQKNSLVALTVALPVNRNHSVKLSASTGLATRIGSDADTFGVAWQYRWGGGL
jgi:hypothetical protein